MRTAGPWLGERGAAVGGRGLGHALFDVGGCVNDVVKRPFAQRRFGDGECVFRHGIADGQLLWGEAKRRNFL